MNSGLFALLIGILLIVALLILLWHPQRSRSNADRPLTGAIYRDDDRYWVGGVFYNNPEDPAMFVPKRFGLGWTVNFGNPWGRLFLLGTLLLPLVLLILNFVLTGGAPVGCHPSGCYP
jgi:uncharacterized membrane protein